MIEEMIHLLLQKHEFFLELLMEHLQLSFLAISIACILGLTLGILISEYKKSSKFILAFINFIYTIPSIALLGFLIPFSGIGNPTAILALSIYALLPMVRNTYTGMDTINPNILEAAKGMGSTRLQILWKIKFPLALPIIISGLRNMATMTIALAGIASFIGAGGLGVAIYRGITTNNTAMTLVGSLLIALLALLVDAILGVVQRFIAQKHKKKKQFVILSSILVLLCLFLGVQPLLTQNTQEKHIQLATKPMTEQYIMGAMIKEMVEQETDLIVDITQGVGGGTSNIMPAMLSETFDLYPEYTSTGWNMVLKHDGIYDESLYEQLQQEYLDAYDYSWTARFGFNDSFGLAVQKDIAETYQLKTYSDLAKISSNLVFGANYDFYERPDGYDAMVEAYGFNFKKTMDMDIGLKYQAMREKSVDVMSIFTTDGQLANADVVVLEDDRQFFSSAMAGIIIRNDVLDEHPQLQGVFDKLEDILDDKKMAELNYQVETNGIDAEIVAHDFLVSIHLIQGNEGTK